MDAPPFALSLKLNVYFANLLSCLKVKMRMTSYFVSLIADSSYFIFEFPEEISKNHTV